MLKDGGKCTRGYHIHGTSKGKATASNSNKPGTSENQQAKVVIDQAKGPSVGKKSNKDNEQSKRGALAEESTTTAASTANLVRSNEESQAQTLSFLEEGVRGLFQKILQIEQKLEQLRTNTTGNLLPNITNQQVGLVCSTPRLVPGQVDQREAFYRNLPLLLNVQTQ